MVDDAAPADPTPRCTWCSAELPSANEAACPSCGATLVGDGESAVPGVTALDAEAIIRNARNAVPQRRNRLLSWISGEYDESAEAPAPPGSLDLPPAEVRREMLRLELEAEVANLQAETEALVSEAEIEAREEGWEPPIGETEAATDGDAEAPEPPPPVPADPSADAVDSRDESARP